MFPTYGLVMREIFSYLLINFYNKYPALILLELGG